MKYGLWAMHTMDPDITRYYLVQHLGHGWWITHSKHDPKEVWLEWAKKQSVGIIGKTFEASPEFISLTKEEYFAEIL